MGLIAEALYGSLLLSVPVLSFPPLLYLPCSYLFGGKFLFGPAISILYDDDATRVVPRWKLNWALTAVTLALVFVPMMKGIHSNPWTPGLTMESAIPLLVVSALILSAFIAWLWAKTHTLSTSARTAKRTPRLRQQKPRSIDPF